MLSLQEYTACLLFVDRPANGRPVPHTIGSKRVRAIQQEERVYPKEPTGSARKPASKQQKMPRPKDKCKTRDGAMPYLPTPRCRQGGPAPAGMWLSGVQQRCNLTPQPSDSS